MNENQTQNTQNTQKVNQANNQAAQQAEPKTVINGKVVSLQQAQAMEEAFNNSMNKTGIQAHHDNSTEAIKAGDVAQSASTAEASAAQQYNQQAIRQTDVQSGQQHLQEFEGQAQQMVQQAQQQTQQAQQQAQQQQGQQGQSNTQAVNAAAQEHTLSSAAGADAQQAADNQKAAAEAKARAKKGQ